MFRKLNQIDKERRMKDIKTQESLNAVEKLN